LQADVLLQADDVADRVVLDLAQPIGGDATGREVRASLQQLRRPEQAADVVGAERRTCARRGRVGVDAASDQDP
jgi:hypothetical protein